MILLPGPGSVHGQDTVRQKAEAVYEKIKLAAGDHRPGLPRLVIQPEEQYVAAYSPAGNALLLDRKAFDICMKQGCQAEAALAFLIGHELTHFYQQQDWRRQGYAPGFLLSREEFRTRIEEEKEADIYGASYRTRQAGLRTSRGIGVDGTLERIRQAYPEGRFASMPLGEGMLVVYPIHALAFRRNPITGYWNGAYSSPGENHLQNSHRLPMTIVNPTATKKTDL